jgi:Tuberculosis necrotizing toxin
MNFLKSVLTLLLFLTTTIVKAQVYPVQVSVSTAPPYYNFLSHYGDQNNHLLIIATLTDFNSPPVNVRLRLKIEGQGYVVQTRTDVPVGNVFQLSPGFPVFIQGSDVLPLLQENALTVTSGNPDLNNLLEGFTTICVEVVEDNANGAVLATNNCTAFFLQLMQPPQAFLPVCNSVVDTSAMFQTFQWSPPQNYIPGIGTDLNYTFSLYEWIDTTNFTIFQTGQGLVYQTQTAFPMVQVSNFDLAWQPGRKYVWRVQAQLTSNGVPVQMITNNGISAPCAFYYGKPQTLAESLSDGLVINVTAQGVSSRKGLASCTVVDETPNQGLSGYNRYLFEYRAIASQGTEFTWLPDTVSGFQFPIYRLEPERTYEVRVRGIAGNFLSEPSAIVTFTTPPVREYVCGEADLPYLPTQYQPLISAHMGDVFQIGQFALEVTDILPLGQPGHFKGRGTIPHSFIAGARIKVKFDDLLVDNQFNVREGMASAITDGVDSWLNDQYLNQVVPDTVHGVIESGGFLNDSTVFVVVNGDSLFFSFENDLPIVIYGDNNVAYQFWPNGTMVVTTYGLIPSNDQLDAIADLYVHFESATPNDAGFDKKIHPQFNDNYEVIICQDQFQYFVPNKSKNANSTETVKAIIHGTIPSFLPSEMVFKLAGGYTIVPHTQLNDSTFLLTLPAKTYDYKVYAEYSELKLGKLNVKSYTPITEKVLIVPLVPMNGITEAQIETQLNNIYKGANLLIDASIAPQFNTPEFSTTTTFANPNTSLMQKYTAQMRALREAYLAENTVENGTSIVFVIHGFTDPLLDGFMVRGRGVGFVAQSTLTSVSVFAHTLSHELGHGIGGLEHAWGDNASLKNQTNNLMDYSGGTQLIKKQWEALRDQSTLFSLFDDAEEFMSSTANQSFNADSLALESMASGRIDIPMTMVSAESIFRTTNGFYVQFPQGTRSQFTHFSLRNGLLEALWNGSDYFPIVTTSYTFSTIFNPNTSGNDTIAWEHATVVFMCSECVHESQKTTLENGDTLTTFKFIEDDIRLQAYQYIRCEDAESFVTGYNNGTTITQTVSCQTAGEECNAEFITQIDPDHVQLVTQKLNHIVNTAGWQVGYNPVGQLGDDQFLTENERAVIGEKIKSLRMYRANTVVAYVFLENEGNYLYSDSDLKQIADDAVNSVSQNNPNKTIALFLMNYTQMEQHGLLQVSNKSCMTLTFATNQTSFIAPGILPSDLSTVDDLYSSMLFFFSKLKKPYYKFNIYEKYDGSLVHHLIDKTANPSDDIYGLPFVHGAQHLISKKRGNYEAYQEQLKEVLDEYEAELEDNELTVEDLAEWNQLQNEYMPLLSQWKEEAIDNPNDWNQGTVSFMNIRESLLNRNIALAEFKKEIGGNTFFIDIAIWQYGAAGVLNQNTYYEFNVMDRIVDPIVYGVIDILGCIPIVDFFADGAGMLYATARGDGQEMLIYSAALATPFVGAGVYHSGQKLVNYYAKQTAEGVFQVQCKLLEDNLAGWTKISDDIPIKNETVQSKLDELNSSTSLEAFDDETVEALVKVKTVANVVDFARGVSKTDFFNSVTDFQNGANATLAEEAWILWKNEDWTELENLITTNNINGDWPPNSGFINIEITDLNINFEFDRYGGRYVNDVFTDNGTFVATAGASFESRALPPSYLTEKPYKRYRVINTIPNVKKGNAIPWFNQQGNGIQFQLQTGIDDLIEQGFIIEIL